MSWRRFFRRKRADPELAHEIDHYLTEEINDNLARGMSDGEARRRAYVKFGQPATRARRRVAEQHHQPGRQSVARLEVCRKNAH